MKETPESLTVTVPDAARMLGIDRQTAYRMVRAGRLPVVRMTPHRYRVPVAAIDRLIADALRDAS